MAGKIYCFNTGTLYIVHSPSTYTSAVELEERLRKSLKEISEDLGIDIVDIMRLNTGVETERELAEKILNNENCFEIEIW